jgi:hypothetical protein
MNRSVLVVVVALLAMVAQPRAAYAVWCSSDPVFRLNGTTVDVSISIPVEYMSLVNGPVVYTIQTPPNISREVVVEDPGFNGYGSTVDFVDRGAEVDEEQFLTTVKVYVPIDRRRLPPRTSVPTILTVFPLNGTRVEVSGTSDWTAASVWITGTH